YPEVHEPLAEYKVDSKEKEVPTNHCSRRKKPRR
ncbi:hypothetical protein LCGC14_1809920, partial [marine sediment metagenome]